MTEFNEREQLVIAQALYNALGEIVSTKDADSLRGQADDFYKALYMECGAKSYDMKIGDEKVGTYSVKLSKAKPQIVSREFTVVDPGNATGAASGLPSEAWWAFIAHHLRDFASWYFTETGELLEGCELVELVTPEQPPAYMGGTLRIDAKKVADALRALGAAPDIFGFLEAKDE